MRLEGGSGRDAAADALQLEKLAQQCLAQFKGGGRGDAEGGDVYDVSTL